MEFRLKGGKELHDLLQQLPAQVEVKLLRNAMAVGAKLLRDEARAVAPLETGIMKRAIKSSRNTKNGRVTAKVKMRGKHSYLGTFMEFGVAPHAITVRNGGTLKINGQKVGKSVMHPGHTAKPFLRPTLERFGEEAVNAIGKYLQEHLKFKPSEGPLVSVDEEEV